MTRPLLEARQVAERLSVSVTWFYKNREELEATGFPKKLPGFRQGRWSAEAIDAWIAKASGAPSTEICGPTPKEAAQAMEESVRNLLRSRGHAIARRFSGHA